MPVFDCSKTLFAKNICCNDIWRLKIVRLLCDHPLKTLTLNLRILEKDYQDEE